MVTTDLHQEEVLITVVTLEATGLAVEVTHQVEVLQADHHLAAGRVVDLQEEEEDSLTIVEI